MEVLSQEL